MQKKVSPLKLIAALHHEINTPTKVFPKSKEDITPRHTVIGKNDIQEVELSEPKAQEVEIQEVKATVVGGFPSELEEKPVIIQDSTVVFNFNFNLDSETVKAAVENGAKLMTGLAASAAMIGTAFVFSAAQHKKSGFLRIPHIPKLRLSKNS